MPRNPLDSPRWPDPQRDDPDGAAIERYKSRLAEIAKRRDRFLTAEHESRVAVETAQIEVIKGTLERARDSAKTVQTAATAISGLYTGVAALLVVDKQALPVRGVMPMLFLGAAVVFSTLFLAWITAGKRGHPFPSGVDAVGIRVDRVDWFNGWVMLPVLSKAWMMRAAALCLAAAVVFLPAAFIPVTAAGSAAGPGGRALADDGHPAVVPDRPNRPPRDDVPAPGPDEPALGNGATVAPSVSGFKVDEEVIWFLFTVTAITIAVVVWYQATSGALSRQIRALTYSHAPPPPPVPDADVPPEPPPPAPAKKAPAKRTAAKKTRRRSGA